MSFLSKIYKFLIYVKTIPLFADWLISCHRTAFHQQIFEKAEHLAVVTVRQYYLKLLMKGSS